MKKEDYKPGQRYRVTGLPANYNLWSPTEGSDHLLQNGDIITLDDPPTGEKERWIDCTLGGSITHIDILLLYKPLGQWIPSKWVTPIDNDHSICTCKIMITGCVCGVFAAEMNAKEG